MLYIVSYQYLLYHTHEILYFQATSSGEVPLRPETSPSFSGDQSTEEAVDDGNISEEMDLRQV